jgi:hypothetical protein
MGETEAPVEERIATAEAADPEFKNAYWAPYLAAVLIWPLYTLLFFVAVVFPRPLNYALAAPIFLILLPTLLYAGIGGLINYYRDAKDITRSDHEYSPWWGVWTIAHLLAGILVGPLYFFRRRKKIGTPTNEECRELIPFL